MLYTFHDKMIIPSIRAAHLQSVYRQRHPDRHLAIGIEVDVNVAKLLLIYVNCALFDSGPWSESWSVFYSYVRAGAADCN